MKKFLLAAALLCAPFAVHGQSFVAYQTTDVTAPGRGALGVARVVDWRVFDPFDRLPFETSEWAFGFMYTGPDALLESLSVKVELYEGNFLGINFLQGTDRQTAQSRTSWSIAAPDMARTVDNDAPYFLSGMRLATVAPSEDVWLRMGEVYWISLAAIGPVLFEPSGPGDWLWTGSDEIAEYAAQSVDRGSTWASVANRGAGAYVVNARLVPEPSAFALLTVGIAGLFFVRRLRSSRWAKPLGRPRRPW